MKNEINTVLEDRIESIAEISQYLKLGTAHDFNSYEKILNSIINKINYTDRNTITWSLKGLRLFVEAGSKNYVLGKDFYKALIKSSEKTDLSKIPVRFLLGDAAYQVTIPYKPYNMVIHFNVGEEELNIVIFIYYDYKWAIKNNKDDFQFFCFKTSKNESCKDMIDNYFKNIKYSSGNKEELDSVLNNMFKSVVNIMLYLNNGKPDLREERNLPTYNKKQKLKNGIKTLKPYITVGYSFKKETLVNGFFRWQPYGPNNSLRRYQFIEGFKRG